MRLGITFPQEELGGDPQALHRFAVTAEQLGFDHLLLYDHVVGVVRDVPRARPQPARGYDESAPFHDPLVAFGYIAAVTRRIELITGVLVLPQRQTALVARQAADVQLLSAGRLRLGVGVGYNPVEYDALGQDWATRGRRLDEQIPLLRRLWTGAPIAYAGQFDRIDHAAVNPPPRVPIPIWIGGSSEAAYQRAARLGDGFVFGYGMSEQAAGAWRRVQELLAEQGRDVSMFRALFNLLPDTSGSWLTSTLDSLRRLRDQGASDVAMTSGRNGLRGLDEHLDFITRLKHAADAALA